MNKINEEKNVLSYLFSVNVDEYYNIDSEDVRGILIDYNKKEITLSIYENGNIYNELMTKTSGGKKISFSTLNRYGNVIYNDIFTVILNRLLPKEYKYDSSDRSVISVVFKIDIFENDTTSEEAYC